MIEIEGKYSDEQSTEPWAIEAWGLPGEIAQATRGYDLRGPVDDDVRAILISPPKRTFVRHISERAEVKCADVRLIDWMKHDD